MGFSVPRPDRSQGHNAALPHMRGYEAAGVPHGTSRVGLAREPVARSHWRVWTRFAGCRGA